MMNSVNVVIVVFGLLGSSIMGCVLSCVSVIGLLGFMCILVMRNDVLSVVSVGCSRFLLLIDVLLM